MSDSLFDKRMDCLRLAVAVVQQQMGGKGMTSDQVVKVAEKFYGFVVPSDDEPRK